MVGRLICWWLINNNSVKRSTTKRETADGDERTEPHAQGWRLKPALLWVDVSMKIATLCCSLIGLKYVLQLEGVRFVTNTPCCFCPLFWPQTCTFTFTFDSYV